MGSPSPATFGEGVVVDVVVATAHVGLTRFSLVIRGGRGAAGIIQRISSI